MRCGRAHDDAAGWIDAVVMGECERRQAEGAVVGTSRSAGRPGGGRARARRGRRRPSPAGRRGARGRPLAPARPPVEDEVRRPRSPCATTSSQPGSSRAEAPTKTASLASGCPRGHVRRARPRPRRTPRLAGRWLELAEGAHLRRRREGARLPLGEAFQCSGDGSGPHRSSSRPTRFACAWSRRTSNQMHRVAMPCRFDLEHLVPCAGEVRVVQHDAAGAAPQLASSASVRARSVPPRSSRLRPDIATGDMLHRGRALPGAGMPHHEHDVRIAACRASGRDVASCPGQVHCRRVAVTVVELRLRRPHR